MQFLKRQWRNFVNYLVDNKKRIIINYLIFFIVMGVLLIIDLVTKQCLFNPNNEFVTIHSNWLFGIRSVRNEGLTFFPSAKANSGLLTFLNVLILLICLTIIIFLRSWVFSIFIAFIFAGALGNMVDRLAFAYVRDIIYLPWADKGTFNFADVDVVFGCAGVIITMIVFLFNGRASK